MLKKPLLFWIFLMTIQVGSFGQSDTNASYQSDTMRVNRYIEHCGKILFFYPDSSLKYMDTILQLSKKTNYQYGLVKAYNLKGILSYMNKEPDEALKNYRIALEYAETTEPPRLKALVLGNMGLVFKTTYQHDSVVTYLNKTIQYCAIHNIPDILSKAYLDLGTHYSNRGNYVEAAQNLMKSREIMTSVNDSMQLVYVYNSFGYLYMKLNKFDEALYNLKKAIEIDQLVQKVNILANTYINLGELYFHTKKDYDSALYYYERAVVTAIPHEKDQIQMVLSFTKGNIFAEKKELDSTFLYYQKVLTDPLLEKYPDREAGLRVNLGGYYLYIKDVKNARYFLDSGYKLSDSLGIMVFKKNALMALSELDSLLGNFKGSLAYYKQYKIISDSLVLAEARNQMAVLEFEKDLAQQKYDNHLLMEQNSLKSKQILNQRNLIYLSLLASVLLVVFIYLLYYNRGRIKKLNMELSVKHHDLTTINEELQVTNETLNTQQDQLKALNNSKDKFFSILGHDLKSPFNSLLGLLDLLVQQWDIIEDNEKREMIQSLYTSSEITYQLLEEILSWGKAQQGLIKCQPANFNVVQKIRLVTDLFKSQLKEKNQRLLIELSPEMQLNTDPRLFSQVIQNLMNNSIKYTPHGGTITIDSKSTSEEISVCVSDTGIGIPEDKISQLFNLDCDFNRPGTDNEKSTGMGLILSKEFAEIMGARLTASSIDEKGSSFCLSFRKK